jgi:hypothetical protein
MRFDWYQATVMADPVQGIEELSKLGDTLLPCDNLAKAYRYNQGFHVHHRDKGNVATVLMGGSNGSHFHAWASSENTDDFVSLVRDRWGSCHLVTRADPAEDFIEEGVTKRMLPVMKRVAKRHRLKFARRMDMIDKTAGITQYMGSDSSDYKVRGYEKGYEQIGKIDAVLGRQGCRVDRDKIMITNTLTGEMIRPQDWFRLELQMRPRQEESRMLLATLTPEQAWGCTHWTKELAQEAMALDLERIVMRTRKNSAFDESVSWACRMYGKIFVQLAHERGEEGAMRHLLDVYSKQQR